MTNPSDAIRIVPALDAGGLDGHSRLRAIRSGFDGIARRRLLAALDIAATGVVVATFAQVGAPELLFHVVFVILTAEAFLFGRRICLERVALVSVALLLYASLPSLGVATEPLELTEWPLMFTIAVLVAWMADREQSVGRRYAGLYRETRDRLVRAQEEERARIARDLHDGIGQTLTALTLTLDAAASAGEQSGAARALERSRELAGEALAETRLAAERIRPPRLEARGLASALRAMAAGLEGLVEVVIGTRATVRMDGDTELEVYRIAQEALRNAVEHASARQIRVSLERTENGLRLEIQDDGHGFDPARVDAGRLGLVGMGERAAVIGCPLEIDSAPGRGTQVSLTIPATLLLAAGTMR